MTRSNLAGRLNSELVSEFAALAKAMGAAVLDSESGRANRIFALGSNRPSPESAWLEMAAK
jgi:hypothetical protein